MSLSRTHFNDLAETFGIVYRMLDNDSFISGERAVDWLYEEIKSLCKKHNTNFNPARFDSWVEKVRNNGVTSPRA